MQTLSIFIIAVAHWTKSSKPQLPFWYSHFISRSWSIRSHRFFYSSAQNNISFHLNLNLTHRKMIHYLFRWVLLSQPPTIENKCMCTFYFHTPNSLLQSLLKSLYNVLTSFKYSFYNPKINRKEQVDYTKSAIFMLMLI